MALLAVLKALSNVGLRRKTAHVDLAIVDIVDYMTTAIQKPLLDAVLNDAKPYVSKGTVASYIPALSRVPANKLAISTATKDAVVSSGDVADSFTIQSVSKVFTLALALQQKSGAELWRRVGREPSGHPFSSIILLEREKGIPRNPFINAGALVVADILCSAWRDPIDNILHLFSLLTGDKIEVDAEVAASEQATGDKNRALAHLIKSYGNLENDVEKVLDVYFRQCAIKMTVEQLAKAAKFLAFDGVDQISKKSVVTAEDARRINALMLMAGTYDAAGMFAFEIGIPCKSGVGGAILGVVPDVATVCVWSPGLDGTGNSLAGRAALSSFVAHSGMSVF